MIFCNCLYCDNCQNHVQVLTTESIFPESAPQIKALDRNPSAFSTLFARGKSWDNVRSTTAPYTESRLTRSVANERVGFPVVEQVQKLENVFLPLTWVSWIILFILPNLAFWQRTPIIFSTIDLDFCKLGFQPTEIGYYIGAFKDQNMTFLNLVISYRNYLA